MAIAGPVLTGMLVLAQTKAGRSFSFDVIQCQWGVGARAQGVITTAFGVVNLAISLTFVTDALRRQSLVLPARVLWAMALLCANIVAIPAYWLLYLREPSRTE